MSRLCMLFDSCIYVLKKAKQNVITTEENREKFKNDVLKYGINFLYKTHCPLVKMKVSAMFTLF